MDGRQRPRMVLWMVLVTVLVTVLPFLSSAKGRFAKAGGQGASYAMLELRHEHSPAAEATTIEIPRRAVELLALFSSAMELGEELSGESFFGPLRADAERWTE